MNREALTPLLVPGDAQRLLAGRVRDARLRLGLTQKTLAERAGVTYATLRRFERSGDIAVKYLVRIFNALGHLDEFDQLLKPAPAASLAELEARVARPARKRGTR
jgi:transcriptional regulator with XRE-family HTH domain